MSARPELSVADLKTLIQSPRSQDRLRALRAMNRQVLEGQPKAYLDLAAPLICDPCEDCRWQAAMVISEYLDVAEERVWSVVDRYITTGNETGVDTVATVLVEHLLERDFQGYFQRLKKHWQVGYPLAVELLTWCWPFGEAEAHWDEVEALIETAQSAEAE